MRVIAQKAGLPAMLLLAVTVAGCKPSAPATSQGTTSASPSNPSAPGSATPGQPQNGSPAPTLYSDGSTGPAQPQTTPTPPPPATAPVGTRVVIRTTESLSASHNEVGDKFTGELSQAIVSRATTLFPRGTRISGTVVAARGRGRFKGSGALGIELNDIGGVHVQTSEFEKEVSGKGKRTGGLIGGGVGLGAIIGGLAGGGKGAVIGGLAGAGAGTAGAAYTGNKDVVLPSESIVTFTLTVPLTAR